MTTDTTFQDSVRLSRYVQRYNPALRPFSRAYSAHEVAGFAVSAAARRLGLPVFRALAAADQPIREVLARLGREPTPHLVRCAREVARRNLLEGGR